MRYMPPFELLKIRLLKNTVTGKIQGSTDYISISYADLLDAIKLILRSAEVDEKWYLDKYPDVAQAIADGVYKNARHHFIENGYFEGRHPYELVVDEKWYLEAYPDVAEGIESGELTSAEDHFKSHGYVEGRMPSEF